MEWSAILGFLSKWLSSGPLGIVLGIVGLGGIGVVIYRLTKWIKEQKFQSDVNEATSTAGRESASLSNNLRVNSDTMSRAIIEEMNRLGRVTYALRVPEKVKVNVPFTIVTEKIPAGYAIYADRKWIIGHTTAAGVFSAVLTSPGSRTIDVQMETSWLSVPITVVG